MKRARATAATRRSRIRNSLTRREWAMVAVMAAVVLTLHVLGWGTLLAVVVPQNFQLGSTGVFGVGLGATAYALGLRHAFDADHIAAVDNTTRTLMHGRPRPVSVGFWFSLGHSSVVFALCALLAAGARVLVKQAGAESSTLHTIMQLVGTGISAGFLCLIGIINLVILLGIVKIFRRMRHGYYDETALDDQLKNRGLFNRIFGRATRVVRRPWQMYFVGLLFGLGFDTATEVTLLVLAGGAAAFALPWYAILTLPVIFAAGMSLLDTIDGCFMNFAYGWAFSRPVRKVYYNLFITALSVAVAFVIGFIELASILIQKAGITSGPVAALGNLDLNAIGYVVAALFLLAWVAAMAIWRFGHVETKWSAALQPRDTAEGLQPLTGPDGGTTDRRPEVPANSRWPG